MDIRSRIQEVLKSQYGDFETHLEHLYQNKIIDKLTGDNIKDKKKWVTYNQVILELKHSIKDNLRVKELQYKLTDNSDPDHVCIEVLEEVKARTPELERLYYKIINFI
jgi:hypothetical protein